MSLITEMFKKNKYSPMDCPDWVKGGDGEWRVYVCGEWMRKSELEKMVRERKEMKDEVEKVKEEKGEMVTRMRKLEEELDRVKKRVRRAEDEMVNMRRASDVEVKYYCEKMVFWKSRYEQLEKGELKGGRGGNRDVMDGGEGGGARRKGGMGSGEVGGGDGDGEWRMMEKMAMNGGDEDEEMLIKF
jgi:hypothetical protein